MTYSGATPTHTAWRHMKERCDNPNCHLYERYGGRGIRYCEQWQKYSNFFQDMGEKPLGYELDRINNNGDYTPDNCRWVSSTENRRNTSRNVIDIQSAKEIKELLKIAGILPNGSYPHGTISRISKELDISIYAIRSVARGETWKDV